MRECAVNGMLPIVEEWLDVPEHKNSAVFSTDLLYQLCYLSAVMHSNNHCGYDI